MKRRAWLWLGLLLAAFAAGQWFASRSAQAPATSNAPAAAASQAAPIARAPGDARSTASTADASELPVEARATLARIAAGGPFAYRQDGGVFGNRERLLPPRPRGFYREYTVQTPGSDDRGARRIVAGGDPPSQFWYSDDHYRSFRRIDAQAMSR